MKKIMMATDFSERSERALRRAILLAKQFQARLVFVHAVDDDQPTYLVESERDLADDLLGQLRNGLLDVESLECETRVLIGDAFEALRLAAEAEKPDLLIIGAHRRRLLHDIFIGTTAERTIRAVNCPVLMANTMPLGPYRSVLQSTDLSSASRDALRRFKQLGIGAAAKNAILHVFNVPVLRLAMGHSISEDGRMQHIDAAQDQARRALFDFLAEAGLQEMKTIVQFEKTSVPHLIEKVAAEEKADLVVLSTKGLGGVPRALMGSVTEEVLRTSKIDVLAIPPQQPIS